MPPQMPSGFDAPGFSGSISSTENDINRLFVQFPEPEIPVPQYHSSVNPFAAAEEVPPEDYLRRPNYLNMFSVVYDVNTPRNPPIKYTAGVIVDGTDVFNVPSGSTPGDLIALSPSISAPQDADITFWLNVMPDRSASKVERTKNAGADISIPVARMVKGRNGFIQQLHRGAVFMGGGGGGASHWKVSVTLVDKATRSVLIECDPAGATVSNDKFLNVPIHPTKLQETYQLPAGDSKYVIYVRFSYGFNYTSQATEMATLTCERYTPPTGNNKDMRYRVNQMLTSTEAYGEARQVIALLSFNCTGEGDNLVLKQAITQITTTSLRQVWINGYWETNPRTGKVAHGAACFLDVSSGDGMTSFPTPA